MGRSSTRLPAREPHPHRPVPRIRRLPPGTTMPCARLQYPYDNRHEDGNGADCEKVEEEKVTALAPSQISVRLSHRLDAVRRLHDHRALRRRMIANRPTSPTAANGSHPSSITAGVFFPPIPNSPSPETRTIFIVQTSAMFCLLRVLLSNFVGVIIPSEGFGCPAISFSE